MLIPHQHRVLHACAALLGTPALLQGVCKTQHHACQYCLVRPTCIAVRDTSGNAAAWSKDTPSGMLASRLLLIVAYSAYVPADGSSRHGASRQNLGAYANASHAA